MNRTALLTALCLLLALMAAGCSLPVVPTPTASPAAGLPTLTVAPPGTFTVTPTASPSPTFRPTSTETASPSPSATIPPSPEPTAVAVVQPERIFWAETTSLPVPLSASFGDFRGKQLIFHNDFVYVFGGWASTQDRRLDVYYSAIGEGGGLEAWNTTTHLPPPAYDYVVVKANGLVYLLTGGASEDAVYYALLLADGSIGGWLNTAPLAPSRQNFAAASYGNYIYAAGGDAAGSQDFVQVTSVRSDGSLDEWSFTTPLPVALQAHTMLAYRGYLYVFGGAGPDGQRVDTVYYAAIGPDGRLGAWLETTPMPSRAAGYSTFESNGYVYLLGGNLGAAYYTRIQDDHSLGAWARATALPAGSLHALRSGAYRGIAYAVGGFNLTSFRDEVYYGAIGTGIEGVTSTPTITPTPGPGTAPAVTLTTTPAGSACALNPGTIVQVTAGANLWSEPDVALGEVVGQAAAGVSYYVLSGPVWGRVQAGGAAGWWWELSPQAGGSSAGWVWEGRIAGCN